MKKRGVAVPESLSIVKDKNVDMVLVFTTKIVEMDRLSECVMVREEGRRGRGGDGHITT